MDPPQFASIICWQYNPVLKSEYEVKKRYEHTIEWKDPPENPLDVSDRGRSTSQEGAMRSGSPRF